MHSEKQTATPVGGQQPTRAPGAKSLEARVSSFYRTALLIDGAWFSKALGVLLNVTWPKAADVYHSAASILEPNEHLYRIFFYESKPCDSSIRNPLTNKTVNLAQEPAFSARTRFFSELGCMPFVALRRGEAKFRGWSLRDDFSKKIMQNKSSPITSNDIRMEFTQKGVDMRIGIDVATLALKRLVDRIIIFTGDTDMVPAIKLARTEGVQVGVVQVGTWNLQNALVEDSDFIRTIKQCPQSARNRHKPRP